MSACWNFPDVFTASLRPPPCTVFANSGARWPRTTEEMIAALGVVDACLRVVAVCNPIWWALENPVGKLRRYLGSPKFLFNPCDFGDPYTKRTCIWGNFAPPIPDSLFVSTRSVEPVDGSKMHLMTGATKKDSVEVYKRKKLARSATPLGFSRAFFEANP
jgi:hypothetical protein